MAERITQTFRRSLTALAFLFLLPAAANAQEMTLVGLAMHEDTGREIYLGGLYLPAGTARPSDLARLPAPWAMEYRVVARRTSIRSLLGGILLQSEVATGRAPGPATTAFADSILSSVQSSLYAGDAFRVELSAGASLALLNGQRIARSSNPEVASYFLQGWVGETGPSAAFRTDLTAASPRPELLARLQSTRYSTEREAEIAGWFTPVAAATTAAAATPEVAPVADTATVTGNTTPTDGPPPGVAPLETGNGIVTPPDPPPAADAGGEPVPDETTADVAQEPAVAALEVEENNSEVLALDVQQYSQRLAEFHSAVITQVYREIQYPKRAVRRSLQGRVELDVRFTTEGDFVEVEVFQSSGHKILDKAAMIAAREAFERQLESIDPVALEEFGAGDNQMVVPVPVQFRLQ